MDPPGLVTAGDARQALADEPPVRLHSVLWSAACIVWAQPEHLAFVLLEADDVESALGYVRARVPECWSLEALPVWDLPAQLPLVNQIRVVPPLRDGQQAERGEAEAEAAPGVADADPEAAAAREGDATTLETPVPEGVDEPLASAAPPAAGAAPSEAGMAPPEAGAAASEERAAPPEALAAPSEERAAPSEAPAASPEERAAPPDAGMAPPVAGVAPPEPEVQSPGTITRLVIALDAPLEDAATSRPAEAAPRPAAPRALLVATAGPARGRTYPIPIGGATIGRLPDNAVCLSDERLSREHARIEFHDGHFWLRDLGSTNGTALNGNPVSGAQVLSNGDTVELGSNMLVVTIDAT
jgi:hypothetical protein